MRFLLIPIVCLTAFASGGPRGDEQRVQHIGAIARIWAEIRYSHPGLAEPRDLDALFMQAVADLKGSGKDEFRQVVARFLRGIGDPATRQIDAPFTTKVEPDPSRKWKDVEWINADTLLVRMNDMVRIFQEEATFQENLRRELRRAKSVVFDLRPDTSVNGVPLSARYDADYLRRIFEQVTPWLIGKPLQIPKRVKRFHYGYGGLRETFWSGSLSSDARTVMPAKGSTAKRIGFLANPATVLPLEVFALRDAGRALLASEGFETDFAAEVQVLDIEPGHQVQIRVSSAMDEKGTVRGTPDWIVPPSSEMSPLTGSLDGLRRRLPRLDKVKQRQGSRPTGAPWPADRDYPLPAFPAREYRLLAAARFWAAIDRLYPYKHLLDAAWDDELVRFIRTMEEAGSADEYQLALQRMVAKTQDSHGRLLVNDGAFWSPRPASLEALLGGGRGPADVRIVDGEVAVTAIGEGAQGIRVGDVVLSIDGEPCSARLQRIRELICASTPQALRGLGAESLFRGKVGRSASVVLRRPDGSTYETKVQWAARAPFQRGGDTFRDLGNGIAYVDLDRLQMESVEPVKTLLKASRSAILDMRGYPTPAANALLAHCVKHPKRLAVRIDVPLGLHSADYDRAQTIQSISYIGQSASGLPMGREQAPDIPLVVLIDERAQSFSESVAVLFEVGADATLVGSPTSGADGVVTACVLPGGLKAEFTGCGFSYADGRRVQRVGVQPKLLVYPTIAGLARGEDEVLARAIGFLTPAR